MALCPKFVVFTHYFVYGSSKGSVRCLACHIVMGRYVRDGIPLHGFVNHEPLELGEPAGFDERIQVDIGAGDVLAQHWRAACLDDALVPVIEKHLVGLVLLAPAQYQLSDHPVL